MPAIETALYGIVQEGMANNHLKLHDRLPIFPEPSLDHGFSAPDRDGWKTDAEEIEGFIRMFGAGFPRGLKHCFPDKVLATLNLDGQNVPLEARL